jgi:hypothetical protein
MFFLSLKTYVDIVRPFLNGQDGLGPKLFNILQGISELLPTTKHIFETYIILPFGPIKDLDSARQSESRIVN